MIKVTRLDGSTFMVNADRIETLESHPDTVITMAGERQFIVREKIPEILDMIIAYKRQIYVMPRVVK